MQSSYIADPLKPAVCLSLDYDFFLLQLCPEGIKLVESLNLFRGPSIICRGVLGLNAEDFEIDLILFELQKVNLVDQFVLDYESVSVYCGLFERIHWR